LFFSYTFNTDDLFANRQIFFMPETKDKKKDKDIEIPAELQEFIEAGVHFGHKKSVVHPGMFPYIFGVRNNIHIIDVEHTQKQLVKVVEFVQGIVQEGKVVLFVGTKVPMRRLVKALAEATEMPYVINRWFGGTITNWETISERIQYLKDLREKTKSEEWKKYTKHERLKMKRELEKLEVNLGGIENMKKLPNVIFVADAKENALAVKEANAKGIPVIGIIDTNVNPKNITYPIPANDDSITSVELILSKVKDAMLKNVKHEVKPEKQLNEIKKTSKDNKAVGKKKGGLLPKLKVSLRRPELKSRES